MRRRRTTRRALVGFTLLFAVFLTTYLWLSDRDDRQWLQEATQYRHDCSQSATALSDCRRLPMQVYERRREGFADPDEEGHLWIGLQGRTGQRFEVDVDGPQWERLRPGDSVTATVWNGEVEEIHDNGGTAEMRTNPVRKEKDVRLSNSIFKTLALIWLCLVPFTFRWADRRHEKQWRARQG